MYIKEDLNGMRHRNYVNQGEGPKDEREGTGEKKKHRPSRKTFVWRRGKKTFLYARMRSVRGRGFLCVQDVSVSTQRQLCAVKVRLYFSYYKLEKSYARGVTFSKLYSEAKAGGGIIYSCVIM